MSISASSGSGETPAALEAQYVVAVLKKANDTQKSQAQGLLDLVKQSTPPQREGVGSLIDVYA